MRIQLELRILSVSARCAALVGLFAMRILPKQLKSIEENSFGKTQAMECAPQGATIKEESHGQIRKEGWQKS